MMKTPWPVSILLICLLGACAATGPLPGSSNPTISFESDLFGESPGIISSEDIYRLSVKQRQTFLRYFNNPIRENTPAHERVSDYLKNITINFDYLGETYTADVALNNSSGNCLSLAILTTALAQVVGVETGYQLVDSAPVFESHGKVIYRGQHVRTKLYDPEWLPPDEGELVFSRPGLLVDYFASDGDRFVSNISQAEYMAMYYNNLAAEAIAREDYNTAFWQLQTSMELAPNNVSAINAMAIVYRRMGDVTKAEEIYQYGIRYLPNKVSLLRNYRALLSQQERDEEVKKISKSLAQLHDSNPFDWLHAGRGAYDDGNFREAVLYYKKAVKVAPYLHESYAGMAKAYYKLGNKSGAERELRNAQNYSFEESTRSMYQAKLMALSNLKKDS
jgi:Tfp pilus assembly protein PilF